MTRDTKAIILALAGAVLGGSAPGLLLADFGLPAAVGITLALVPFTLLPLAIGWLSPTRWWMAGGAILVPGCFAAVALLTAVPRSLAELWVRAPLFLPPVLTLTFALIGKMIGQARLKRQEQP